MAASSTHIQLSRSRGPMFKQAAADTCWEAATYWAEKMPSADRCHIVWRWVVQDQRCWQEVALQAKLAAHNPQAPLVSHHVLEWVHGRKHGVVPWWEATCSRTGTVGKVAKAAGRSSRQCTLTVWQAPIHRLPKTPTLVRHSDLWSRAGNNDAPPLVWVVADDFTPRSGRPSGGEESKEASLKPFAAVFDMQIKLAVVQAWEERGVGTLLDSIEPPSKFIRCAPKVLYHGTGGTREDLEWLTKGESLRPSKSGMNGPGVYLGTFTKATRFAGFHRSAAFTEYGKRKSSEMVVILRTLVFVTEDRIKEPQKAGEEAVAAAVAAAAVAAGDSVDDDKGEVKSKTLAHAWLDAQQAPFVDHEGDWLKGRRWDAVKIPPTLLGTNPETGRDAWIVRNEEWCVRPELVVIRNVADLNVQTVALRPWKPWRRAACIR